MNTARPLGQVMNDGTVFGGCSPDTGKALYVTTKDGPGTPTWEGAMKYAADLEADGHDDWRLPTKGELHVLYQNHDKGALKGTFNESGSDPSGWYWSATENPGIPVGACEQRFSDGYRGWYGKDNVASVRPVRFEPRR